MKKLTMPQKVIELACLAILAGMILGPLLFWSQIPDQIPGHYNSAGEIDRWTGKWELLLLPVFGLLLYGLLSFCCWLIGETIRKGELPRSAYTWIAGTKLLVIGTFAVIEWHMASARPTLAWLIPVDGFLLAALMTGFLVSALRFAGKRGKK